MPGLGGSLNFGDWQAALTVVRGCPAPTWELGPADRPCGGGDSVGEDDCNGSPFSLCQETRLRLTTARCSGRAETSPEVSRARARPPSPSREGVGGAEPAAPGHAPDATVASWASQG
jgi:hypothetical protein